MLTALTGNDADPTVTGPRKNFFPAFSGTFPPRSALVQPQKNFGGGVWGGVFGGVLGGFFF